MPSSSVRSGWRSGSSSPRRSLQRRPARHRPVEHEHAHVGAGVARGERLAVRPHAEHGVRGARVVLGDDGHAHGVEVTSPPPATGSPARRRCFVAPGATSRIAASTRSMVWAISWVERSSRKRTSAVTSTSSGLRCMDRSSSRSSTPSTLADRLLDRLARLRVDALADQQPRVLAAEQERDHEQDQPDDHRGGGVEGRLAGQRGEADAERRDEQAADRRRVLGQHGQDLRVLRVAQRARRCCARGGSASSCW